MGKGFSTGAGGQTDVSTVSRLEGLIQRSRQLSSEASASGALVSSNSLIAAASGGSAAVNGGSAPAAGANQGSSVGLSASSMGVSGSNAVGSVVDPDGRGGAGVVRSIDALRERHQEFKRMVDSPVIPPSSHARSPSLSHGSPRARTNFAAAYAPPTSPKRLAYGEKPQNLPPSGGTRTNSYGVPASYASSYTPTSGSSYAASGSSYAPPTGYQQTSYSSAGGRSSFNNEGAYGSAGGRSSFNNEGA